MDVVYVLGRGEHKPELRHSLRSLVNLPHHRVWFAGFCPSWAQEIGHVAPPREGRTKHEDSTLNLRAACESPEVSERFVYFNDDFYVLRPMAEPPVTNIGPLDEMIAGYHQRFGPRPGLYTEGLMAMDRLLADIGYDAPLCYEGHAPMVVDKAGMLEALDIGRGMRVLHYRTLYGNLLGLGGERVPDRKIFGARDLPPDDWPFVSTSEQTFTTGLVGRWLRERFPQRSPYERS